MTDHWFSNYLLIVIGKEKSWRCLCFDSDDYNQIVSNCQVQDIIAVGICRLKKK